MIARIALALWITAAAAFALAPVNVVGADDPAFDCAIAAGAHGDPTDGVEAVYASPIQIVSCGGSHPFGWLHA